MRCLIVAAGYGSRLSDVSPSKPLTPVAGVPLIAHVIARAAAGGASGFTVVTGHQAEQVEWFLESHAAVTGLDIACVRTEDWSRPNGHSVLTGADTIDGPYILTMADHLVAPALVGDLIAAGAPAGGLALAVDRDMANPDVDLDDVTKVATDADARIVAIGKTLEDYNAYDTGVFAVTPALADAIRAAIAVGKAGSISDGVQALAAAGKAFTVDVTGHRWIDVDDAKALAQAEAWLAN